MPEYKRGRAKPLILHIDDDKNVLKVAEMMLRELGADPLSASSPKEGIKLAEKEQPDIILMDLVMPEMDGLEAVKTLKLNAKTKDIPVLMLTGSDTIKDVEKALAAGASGYIVKPLHADRLKSKIEEWVQL